jgi:hypothetical protein
MTWPPLPDDPDTASETHEVLDSLPEHQRGAAAALMALPEDYVVCLISDDINGQVVGDLTADQLLADLRTGAASPDTVWRILQQRRCLLPGLGGAT